MNGRSEGREKMEVKRQGKGRKKEGKKKEEEEIGKVEEAKRK